MPYGNHMQGQRSNLKLLRKISMFKKTRRFLSKSKKDFSSEKGIIDLKKKGVYNSDYYTAQLKSKKVENKEKKKIYLGVSFITLVILIITFTIVKSIYNNNQEISLQQQQINELNYIEKINEYSYFIEDGDNWIEKKNWHNAIFRYKQAVDLFPKKYEANYRLILAYSYNCTYKNKDCEIGNKLNMRFLKLFPNDKNLLQLEQIFNK